jgi:hypothetical protein
MKMFSDCSGPCQTCKIHYRGNCLAGHGDDDYVHADPEWIEWYRKALRRKADKEAKQVEYEARVAARVAAARALARAGAAEAAAAEAWAKANAAREKAEIADVRSRATRWMAEWMEKRAAGLLDKRPERDMIE